MRRSRERSRQLLLTIVLLLVAFGSAQAKSFESSLDPPRWAVKSLLASGIEVWPGDLGGAAYTVSRHLSPNYVEGDFDGDGKSDVAILIRRKADDKFGMAILLRAQAKSGAKATILGAGSSFGTSGTDFRRMDAWSVQSQESFPPKIRSAWKGPQPKTKRDGLILQKRGSAEALVTYDGAKFVWTPYGG
jgi:hypothetical protein